ncbi:hypothetical protein MRX96_001485 [Rhipicephalus microplus]
MSIFLSIRGRAPFWALRLYTAVATSRLVYAFHVVALPRWLLEHLELLHMGFIHCVVGVPWSFGVAATLADVDVWPLSLLLKQRGLLDIDRLAHAPDGCALLARLKSLPGSRLASCCRCIKQVRVGEQYWVLFTGDSELVAKGVVPDYLHIIPDGGNTLFDVVLRGNHYNRGSIDDQDNERANHYDQSNNDDQNNDKANHYDQGNNDDQNNDKANHDNQGNYYCQYNNDHLDEHYHYSCYD